MEHSFNQRLLTLNKEHTSSCRRGRTQKVINQRFFFVKSTTHFSTGATTNHSVAFDRAFGLLSAENERAQVLYKRHHPHTTYSESATFIFYISKGVLSALPDAAHVMNTIARQRQATQLANVQINTVTLLHGVLRE